MPKRTRLNGERSLELRSFEPSIDPSTFGEATPRETNPSAPALLTGLTALYGVYSKTRGT